MNVFSAGEFSIYRDRSIEILERSANIRARWRTQDGEVADSEQLKDEVANLLRDASAAGESIMSKANRDSVTREIDNWRRWLADEFGEYVPRMELIPSRISQDELQDLDYPNLMILLRQGVTVHGRLLDSIQFARHLDEVRETFRESKFINCRFDKCKFDGANFGAGTKLVYVNFSECSLDYFIWPQIRASSLAFQDMRMLGASFESGVFSDVLLKNFEADRAIFMDANFTYCKFEQTRIDGTNFSGAIFSKCIFDRAIFNACDFSDAVFSECEFVDATISGGSLRRALVTKCDLGNLHLKKGPPRGGDASRRLQVDTDLDSVQVKFSQNLPQSMVMHLFAQDFGDAPERASSTEQQS